MIREDAIITRLTWFAARLTKMDEQQRRLLEDEIRSEFGGEKVGHVRRVNWDTIEERDAEIVAAIQAGEKYRTIAGRLCISVGTVCTVAAKRKVCSGLR